MPPMHTIRSTDAVLLREATAEDTDAVASIGRRGFVAVHGPFVARETLDVIAEETYDATALSDCITACRAAPDAHFLVAEQRGRVVAFLHEDAFGPRPELHRLYVEPALTGRSIGRALVDELERRLPDGRAYVLLVAAGNVGARRFYTRAGFRQLELRPDGLAVLRRSMGLDLPAEVPEVPGLVLERIAGSEVQPQLYLHTRAEGLGPEPLRRWPAARAGFEHALLEAPVGAGECVRLLAPAARWLAA